MAEREVQDQTGKIWSADEWALTFGYRLSEIEFAQWMQHEFGIHGYERMQQLWALRDRSLKRNRSGSFPEGYDISKDMI